MIIIYITLTIIAAFLFILVLRALMFNPKPDNATIIKGETFDHDKCIDALSKLIRCKTISNHDSSLEDDAEFDKLLNMLPQLYPSVFKKCEINKLGGRGILIKWAGKSSDKPTVLMAHYDVVPVTEENWEKPPFDAVIENDVMWGRGTLDTKATFNGILCSADHLIESGFTPENDIYLAFSGSEEINGDGAKNIVKHFMDNNITPALVVDEGGAVVQNVFPGVKQPCALVGIAEKGLLNIEYKMLSAGGHASAPIPNSPIVSLARACDKIEKNPMKLRITKPASDMFNTLGRHSSFVYKIIFSNLWCFKWVLDIICRKSGGEMNALLRTTIAFTMANGSNGRNVIPPEATLISNIRINPYDSCETVIKHLKKTINNNKILITKLEGNEPSRISKIDCDAWNKVKNAIASTWDNTIISPYLMVQCSDSRHYGAISDRVYRFSAMALSSEERKTIHGNNEKIKLESITKVVDFYIKLIKQC